jgi:hypothetical protein
MSLLRTTVIALLLAATTNIASAALAPGTVKKIKAKTSEVLNVELIKVKKGAAKGENQDVIYTARILKVERSKSGLKAGDTIQIQSYIRNPNYKLLPQPGPMPPSLHAKGWKGKVYLNSTAKAKELKIAVYGHSFE